MWLAVQAQRCGARLASTGEHTCVHVIPKGQKLLRRNRGRRKHTLQLMIHVGSSFLFCCSLSFGTQNNPFKQQSSNFLALGTGFIQDNFLGIEFYF